MPRGNSLNHLHGTKASQCPRTAFENLKCPWNVSVFLPRMVLSLGYFPELEETSQATRSGRLLHIPHYLYRDAKQSMFAFGKLPTSFLRSSEAGCLTTPRCSCGVTERCGSQRERKSDRSHPVSLLKNITAQLFPFS